MKRGVFRKKKAREAEQPAWNPADLWHTLYSVYLGQTPNLAEKRESEEPCKTKTS